MTTKSDPDSQREILLQTASKRLYPSLADPNFLVLRSRRIIFSNWINQLPNKGLNVLDVGGRYQPYRPLLEGRLARYVALDILQTELVDVVGAGEALPLAANTFDLVIATQVFDYFLDPRNAADQIHAVLKTGGVLLASLPAFVPTFAANERWRFTPTGIRSTLASFSKVEIIPEVSSVGGLVRTLNLVLHNFAYYDFVRAMFSVTLHPLLNAAGLGLERLTSTTNNQFTPNFSVMALK